MRQDGRLTRAEERTVWRALAIIAKWIEAHAADEPVPYGWAEITQAHHALEGAAWCMFGEEA